MPGDQITPRRMNSPYLFRVGLYLDQSVGWATPVRAATFMDKSEMNLYRSTGRAGNSCEAPCKSQWIFAVS